MKLKTSLWLIRKTCASLKFGSSCIIIAHFSSCPFFPCQAFQAGFPYAPVKTGNCFKRLKHLYFFFFSPPTVWGCLCSKRRKAADLSHRAKRGARKLLTARVSGHRLGSVRHWFSRHLEIPSAPSLPCTRYQWSPTDRDWGRTKMFSALLNQSLSSAQLSVLPGWTKRFRPVLILSWLHDG